MAGEENFCLRFNHFGSNIKTTWQQLQEENDFCDVTLACNDGQIQSHKIIVSHSSPILKNILKQTSGQNPVIYLRGVKYKYLVNLVNFFYQGEVTVSEEDLGKFLDVAEDLQIIGLSQENRESFSPSEEVPIITGTEEFLPHNPNEELYNNPNIEQVQQNSMESSLKRKRKSQKSTKLNSNNCDPTPIAASHNFENEIYKKINLQNVEPEKNEVSKLSKEKHSTQKLVSVIDRQFSCNMCDKHYTDPSNLRRHNASAHEGVRYPCDQCDVMPFAQSSNLKQHKASAHEGVRYSCDQCDGRSFKYPGPLKLHKASAHEGVRYECSTCDYKATTNRNLKNHTKSIHNI